MPGAGERPGGLARAVTVKNDGAIRSDAILFGWVFLAAGLGSFPRCGGSREVA